MNFLIPKLQEVKSFKMKTKNTIVIIFTMYLICDNLGYGKSEAFYRCQSPVEVLVHFRRAVEG